MYGPEGNSFVFLRVLMFPETKSGFSGIEYDNCTIISQSGYI